MEQFLFGGGSAAAEGFGKEQDAFTTDDLEVNVSSNIQRLWSVTLCMLNCEASVYSDLRKSLPLYAFI